MWLSLGFGFVQYNMQTKLWRRPQALPLDLCGTGRCQRQLLKCVFEFSGFYISHRFHAKKKKKTDRQWQRPCMFWLFAQASDLRNELAPACRSLLNAQTGALKSETPKHSSRRVDLIGLKRDITWNKWLITEATFLSSSHPQFRFFYAWTWFNIL